MPTPGQSLLSSGNRVFTLTYAADASNVNIRTDAVAAGWNTVSALKVVINSGVVIGATTTASPAMTTDSTAFPGGLTIENNGTITGKGGAGGNGASVTATPSFNAPTAGSVGGPGLNTAVACTLINTGSIYGGGGGGGGGGAYYNTGIPQTSVAGSGGGGGGGGATSGSPVGGAGGARGTANYSASKTNGVAGAAGTVSAGGLGGTQGVAGGNGGNPGVNGSAGANGTLFTTRNGAAGGNAGASIQNSANATITNTGTILPAV